MGSLATTQSAPGHRQRQGVRLGAIPADKLREGTGPAQLRCWCGATGRGTLQRPPNRQQPRPRFGLEPKPTNILNDDQLLGPEGARAPDVTTGRTTAPQHWATAHGHSLVPAENSHQTSKKVHKRRDRHGCPFLQRPPLPLRWASVPPPPCVTFRRVVAPLRGPGRSPVLPFACCVGSLRSVGRCGRCSLLVSFPRSPSRSIVRSPGEGAQGAGSTPNCAEKFRGGNSGPKLQNEILPTKLPPYTPPPTVW